jgi:hypothetical protein
MAYHATVYHVMIASPSDVALERDFARQVLWEWNIHEAAIHHVVLLPVMWETHAAPDYGDRPQSFVNKQLLRDSDFLVAVFWTRLGTPTGVAESGTVEEIEEFARSGRRVMVYFGTAQRSDACPAELSRLTEFRSRVQKIAYISEFDTPQQFKDKFRQDMISALKSTGVIDADTRPTALPPNVAAGTSAPVIAGLAKQIRRLKTEWELNQTNAPGMFQRAKDILSALHSVITDFYTEIVESQDPTAITLARSALEQIFYLENLPISLSTDVPGYWRAADDVFDLLRRSQECLARKAG